MKKILLLIFILTLVSECLLSQESTDKSKSESKMFLGVSVGTSLSNYIAGSENDRGGLGAWINYDVKYEKLPQIGFTAGFFIEIPFKKHFSLRTDLNYYLTKHRIQYSEEIEGGISADYYGNYYLTGSKIQFSILPKISIGQRNRIYILFGPFFDLWSRSNVKGQIEIKSHSPGQPASDTTITDQDIDKKVNNTIGLLLGLGINIPVKENYFCIEMRSGYGFYDIVYKPNMRQFIVTLSIIYQFKL
jgi:hypothetical protein